MSVSFAILGFLSYGPLSGYDLKKLFGQSETLHWSGNNNQVYSALVQLHRDGLATREVEQPDQGPARKVYSITPGGRAALLEWLRRVPELPQLRIPIFVQLMSADLLSGDELDRLLAAYGDELRLKVWSLEEMERRGAAAPSLGSERQVLLWRAINERALGLFRAEMEWAANLRWSMTKFECDQPR